MFRPMLDPAGWLLKLDPYSYCNIRSEAHYGEHSTSEAWEAVPEEFLDGLINGMGERCWAVIEAEGRYTRF